MGTTGEAIFMSMLDDDADERCCCCAEYACRYACYSAFGGVDQMGCQEVAEAGAWVVENSSVETRDATVEVEDES